MITIVVLLILSGVTLALTLGNNGIISKGVTASREYDISMGKEVIKLAINTMQIEKKSKNEVLILEDLEELPKYESKIVSAELETDRVIANYLGKYDYSIDSEFNVEYLDEAEIYNSNKVEKVGLLSETEYRINNTTLTFNKIVVVGQDEEYKTIKDALDYLCDNEYKNNLAIILKPGTYDTKNVHNGNSYNINAKYKEMEISIIAEKPGETFITSGEMGEDQNNSTYWIKLKFYRIIFTSPVYSDVKENGFHLNSDRELNEYYNCVFLPAVGGYNGTTKNALINTYNCLFLGGANTYYKNYKLLGNAINCASKDTTIDPSGGTKITCLTNVTTDLNYNITSNGWKNSGTGQNPDGTQANIGIYGGEFSW